MRGRCAILAALLLASCGDSTTPDEQALQDARDVARVHEVNEAEPPLELVTPEPILLPDIERYDLAGRACNYAPGTSLGTRVVAREIDAFVKVDGEVQRLAADPGAQELALKTRSVYNGKAFSLQLQLTGDGEGEAGGKANFDGKVTLRDPYGRIVYEGTGLAQCG